MIASFRAVVDEHSTRIVLGTLPSQISLVKGEYYGNPQNDFWRLVGGAFGDVIDEFGYAQKLEYLLDHGIGIWDVLRTGEREGSGDNNIVPISYNQLDELLAGKNQIRYVLLNGKLAKHMFDIGIQHSQKIDLVAHCLPSSSSANRRHMEKRADEWKYWLKKK